MAVEPPIITATINISQIFRKSTRKRCNPMRKRSVVFLVCLSRVAPDSLVIFPKAHSQEAVAVTPESLCFIHCSILPQASRQASITTLKHVQSQWVISWNCVGKRKRISWNLLKTPLLAIYCVWMLHMCYLMVTAILQCSLFLFPLHKIRKLESTPLPRPMRSRTGFKFILTLKLKILFPLPRAGVSPSGAVCV